MSETSSEDLLSDRLNDKEENNNICRDFLRNSCDRKFCKYKHEHEIRTLNFCYDFQNNICPRASCKFIHCSTEEVEEYKRSGEMSNQIIAEATRKNQLPGTPPVCNQFKKGQCRRTHCKFRHVTREQEEQEILDLIQNKMHRKPTSTTISTTNTVNMHESRLKSSAGSFTGLHRRNGVSYDEYQESGLPLAKRRFAVAEEMLNRELQLEADRNRPVFKGYFAGSPPPGVLNRGDARTLYLEEENNLLHSEIAQLKKQVQDLTATNEFLLDQNAALRVSSKQNAVSTGTLTTTNTQLSQPPQVIRTVTASVATVPVSLATVTTGNAVSISGCPTVSIASPAQILAPSQQILVTTNPGQQLALATSTQAHQQLALATAAGQSQQIALANSTQHHQLTSQAHHQQLTANQAQQLALANSTHQQLTVTNVPTQQLTLNGNPAQLLQSNLAASTQQQIDIHRTNQLNAAINTSQAIAMSHATQPMMTYPIMTQSLTHSLAH